MRTVSLLAVFSIILITWTAKSQCDVHPWFNHTISGNVATFTNASTNTISTTSYTWSFSWDPFGGSGPGFSISGGAMPGPVTYSLNGLYKVELKAKNSPTCQTNSLTYMLEICSFTPTMNYSYAPGGLVTFSTNTTAPPEAALWEFGDGPYDHGYSPAHIYFNGTYTVNLNIAHPNTFCDFQLPAVITVTDHPCHADAAYTYILGSGGTVQFTKTAADNPNIAYLWKFGDGIYSTQDNPTHTYGSAGNYKAMLVSYDLTYPVLPTDTAYNLFPCRETNVTNLNVTGVPCVANSDFTLYPAAEPHTYRIGPEYPYNVSSARWDWGDGSASHAMYTSHTYSAAGSYDICLTVTTTCGAVSKTCYTRPLAKGAAADLIYVNVLPPEQVNGVGENMTESIRVELFPNPGEGVLKLRLNKAVDILEVEVYDLLGKKVYQVSPDVGEEAMVLDLRGLNDGIYFLQLNLPQRSITEKFMIAR